MIISAPDPALDAEFARALLRLQHAAYRVEASLLADDRIPALGADDVSLPAWRGRYLVAWDRVRLVGAIAWTDRGDHLDIDRLMVEPEAFRQGIASALLARLLADGRPVETATGRANDPALALYARHGFEPTGDEEPEPGLWVTRLRWAG